MQDMEVRSTYRVNNLKYNAIAARILYSSDCYALENTYYLEDGTERKQVRAGILDIEKLKDKNRLRKCVSSARYVSKIKDLEADKTYTRYPSCDNVWSMTHSGDRVSDKAAKNVFCDGYNEDKVCGKKGETRKVLVLIQDEQGKLKRGSAEFRLCV